MYSSRLIKTLENLPNRQQELFKSFVISPYFNQHDQTIKLLEIILKELDKPKPQLDKGVVFKKLFPKKEYDEQKIHNVMSYLMRLYHRFLAYQQFEEQSLQEQFSTIQQAYSDNQLDVFTNRSKLFERTIEKREVLDGDFYFYQYRYHDLMRDYKINHVSRSDQSSAQKMLNYLDQFYILEKLKHSAMLTAHQMITNTKYEFELLDEVLVHVQSNWNYYQTQPTIAAFYTSLKMLLEEHNPAYYQQLKELLQTYPHHYAHKDLSELYNFTSNYCILKINKGDKDFEYELFETYQQALEREVLLENGKIDGWMYKNIATLGCHLKAFKWTLQFLEDYKNILSDKHKSNAYNYSLAYYYVSTQNYKEAQKLLLQVKFTETQYHLGGNLLLIRSYYEEKDHEALLSLLESMRLYVLRSKRMTTKEKKGYKTFVRQTKKLTQLTMEADYMLKNDLQKKVTALKNKVRESDGLAKSWILNKCELLFPMAV